MDQLDVVGAHVARTTAKLEFKIPQKALFLRYRKVSEVTNFESFLGHDDQVILLIDRSL